MAVAKQSDTTSQTCGGQMNVSLGGPPTNGPLPVQSPPSPPQQQQQHLMTRNQTQSATTQAQRANLTAQASGNNITTNTNSANNNNCCAACQMPIKDRFLFSVIEQSFHQNCVRCADCSLALNERCFTVEGKLYCRLDYWRRFGPKCSACAEPIKPTELVQRLKENLVYHLSCFVCQDCKRHLRAGEQLHLIDEKRILCKRDFMSISSTTAAPTTLNGVGSAASPIAAATRQPLNSGRQPLSGRNVKQEHSIAEAINASAEKDHLSQGFGAARNCYRQPETTVNELELDELDEFDDQDDSLTAIGGGDAADQFNASGAQFQQQHQQRGGAAVCQTGRQTLGDADKSSLQDCNDELVDANGKRRGPRTTIKPKQLETLRRAFESAPKPSRHIREQLAAETGLNMRVIQVWFQNRRSKERRMRNSNGGARRNFFRSSSRRHRVGAAGGGAAASANGSQSAGSITPTSAANGTSGAQQSLMAAGSPVGAASGASRAQAKQQANGAGAASQQSAARLSPLDTNGQQQQQAGGNRQSHNSPSDFGGSSSGGFTYFSDSSNQGDAFAIAPPTQTAAQPQQYGLANGLQAADGGGGSLTKLDSPSGGANSNSQRQYALKGSPAPPQQPQAQPVYQPAPVSQQHHLQQQQQHHLQQHHLHQQQHHLHHVHHHDGQQQQHPQHHQHFAAAAGQLMGQPPPALQPMAHSLLGHPQGPPSVVQW